MTATKAVRALAVSEPVVGDDQGSIAISSSSKEDLDGWFLREVMPLDAMLRRYIARSWREVSERSDLLQDIYTRVYVSAQRERPVAVKPFLFAVARNLIIDKVRHVGSVPVESLAEVPDLDVIDDEPSPEQKILAQEEFERVQCAINNLPPRCRDVLILRRVERISQREVAVRLGITEQIVEYQLAKAMRLLTSALYGPREGIIAQTKRYIAVRGRN
ncbi:RNA polymerase sigma factor [Rhizomicrobium electricum]|jgi:RNA polymerase sigma-70 factor (ECF subfamily)|uniref:RNA polymerase sigma factor n=1 Tax=Rhizomicrobium electricum TaxID=480070 RepID=UPI00141ECD9A|nr:sigma-70 family RNA polymerase sigma factor [Rhizomicrobium electricum]NIJ49095.1 RNA polymerase sigma-70 factor (ECF subfamily) [Rhizomicrobium electricum]